MNPVDKKPIKSLRSIAATVLGVATASYAVAMIFNFLGSEVQLFDESIALVNSMRIAQGERPHTDFWSLYPATGYYLNAVVFRLFGMSVICVRSVHAAFYIGFLTVLWVWFRRVSPGHAVNRNVLMLCATVITSGALTLPWWNACALSTIGLVLYLMAIRAKLPRSHAWCVVAGIAVGLSSLIRLNLALYVSAAVIVDSLIRFFSRSPEEGQEDRPGRALKQAGLFLLPVCAALCAYVASFGRHSPLVIKQLTTLPTLMNYRRLPLGSSVQHYAAALFPLLWIALRANAQRKRIVLAGTVVGLLALLVIIGNFYLEQMHVALAAIIVLVVFLQICFGAVKRFEFIVLMAYGFTLHYFLSRPDQFHLAPLLPLICILLPLTIRKQSWGRVGKMFAAGVLIVVTSLLNEDGHLPLPSPVQVKTGVELAITERPFFPHGDSHYLMTVRGPLRGAPYQVYPFEVERQCMQYLYDRTAPDERVFVGVRDHSSAEMNALRCYWILGRRVGVRHHEFEPGLTTGEKAQREMAEDLERNRVTWIVLTENYLVPRALSAGDYPRSQYLDAYLRDHYQLVMRFPPRPDGRYSIFRRQSPFAPQ